MLLFNFYASVVSFHKLVLSSFTAVCVCVCHDLKDRIVIILETRYFIQF